MNLFKLGSLNKLALAEETNFSNGYISDDTIETYASDLNITDDMMHEDTSLTEGGEGVIDKTALLETCFVDAVRRMGNDEVRNAYLESEEVAALVEAGVVGRRSLVRLRKDDDLTRRIHLASIQKAKEEGSALWEALRKNRIKEKQLRSKIFQMYSNKVKRDAVMAQRRLIKISPKAFNMNAPIR